MNTEDNRNVGTIFTVVSISILFLHFFRYCPMLFEQLIPGNGVVNKTITQFTKLQLFENIPSNKLLALALLVIYLVVGLGKADKRPNWTSAVYWLLAGILLYFGSILLIDPNLNNEDPGLEGLYIAICMGGYCIIWVCISRLMVFLRGSWENEDIFNKEGTSFPQEQRLIETDYSINLQGLYVWKGRPRKNWINFVNPRRGILIMGSPGSGKSWFIIENAIRQLIEKGFALFVYDFKYDSLSLLAYNHFLKFRDQYPGNTKFYTINFDDLSRSHRCNCIDPRTMDGIDDAIDASRTILLSMNRAWVSRQGDFWVESPMNFLAAIIWFLRKYEGGCYCDLPHAIELVHTPYEQLFAVLSTQPEIEVLINPFKQALENKNMELLDGQLSSVKIPLGRLVSKNIYYILSGSDFQLDINNPHAPKIFCLGGSAKKQEALAPMLSLYIDRMCKLINQRGNYRSALICDEFSTVRAATMMTVIATGRSNDIVPVIAIQDFSQLKIHYSQQEAEALFNMPGNIVCGQAHGETSKMVSDRFLKIMQKQVSRSYNSRDVSVSESEHPGTAISQATLSNLSAGEFVGIVADDPDIPIELKAFHARVLNNEADLKRERKTWHNLPEIRKPDPIQVQDIYNRIRQDICDLVKKEISLISDDPESLR